jgi:hypothetical protein
MDTPTKIDDPTKIGIGAMALGILATFAEPILTWSVSGPIMLVCAVVAVWGFSPLLRRPLFSRFGRTISLRDAAAKLYGEMRGTDIGRLMEGHSGAPNILDNAANHILEHVTLEVKRPPSTKWETLPRAEASQLMACDDATGLRPILVNEAIYAEPRLRRKDLRRLIREFKKPNRLTWPPLPPGRAAGRRLTRYILTDIRPVPQVRAGFAGRQIGAWPALPRPSRAPEIELSAHPTEARAPQWPYTRLSSEQTRAFATHQEPQCHRSSARPRPASRRCGFAGRARIGCGATRNAHGTRIDKSGAGPVRSTSAMYSSESGPSTSRARST